MRIFGNILVWAAFLAATLLSVVNKVEVPWLYVGPLLAAGFVGVAMVRLGQRQHRTTAHRMMANIQSLKDNIESIAEKVADLNARKASIDTYDIRHQIDREIPNHLDAFVEARETISHQYGLQTYADIMNHFAAGERYLNRVWSASADGYIDEVHEYLELASRQFAEVRQRLSVLQQRSSSQA
jgi:hypothetical protein